ncbi:MAG TPA: hypothetical protein VJQ81_05785 [Reyranella sp.]|nr:hypothetical protein [Reyranella sp.]
MAERASSRRRRRANGHAKAGHNSGEVPPEIVDRWWQKVVVAQGAVERAAKPLKSRKGELSAIYKAAKADGIDVDALKDAIKADAGDHLNFLSRYAATGKYLRAHQSPLGLQLGLFPLDAIPEVSRAAMAGKRCGLAGRSIDENPYPPGSENFVAYSDAWHQGQAQVRDTMA